jgi:hypothetical protein
MVSSGPGGLAEFEPLFNHNQITTTTTHQVKALRASGFIFISVGS